TYITHLSMSIHGRSTISRRLADTRPRPMRPSRLSSDRMRRLPSHSNEAVDKVPLHLVLFGVSSPAVTRQHPFEVISEEFLHRRRLFRPRIPADATRSAQGISLVGPPQVISREEVVVLKKKDGVTTRVTRRWNHQEVAVQLNRRSAFNDLFNRG